MYRIGHSSIAHSSADVLEPSRESVLEVGKLYLSLLPLSSTILKRWNVQTFQRFTFQTEESNDL